MMNKMKPLEDIFKILLDEQTEWLDEYEADDKNYLAMTLK